MKEKNHMIISKDAEKAFQKIQHPFMIKTLTKVGIEETSQHNKSYLWQTYSQYNTQQWKAESLPTKIWNKTMMPTLTTSIQHSIEVLATAIRQEKEIKGIQIGREEVKLSLYTDDMILYVENSKDSTQKLLDLINE